MPADADVLIIPGSKSTIGDLAKMRENGWDQQIQAHVDRGRQIIGICGGYQILGRSVSDPNGIEGAPTTVKGLGLLDVETVMRPEKRLRTVQAQSTLFDAPLTGYEIHIGETTGPDCARPTSVINGHPDGAVSSDGLVQGTYLHGYFDNGTFRQKWLRSLGVYSNDQDQIDRVSQTLDEMAAKLEVMVDIDGMLAAARSFGG